jgi:hypothetical protein
MSERSERIVDTVFIAAQRRCAHWGPVRTHDLNWSHDERVHQ